MSRAAEMVDGVPFRKVEHDVIVPKMVKQAAREACKDMIAEFEDCCRGRFLSLVVMCRAQNNAMQECFKQHSTDKDFEVQKKIFIEKKRANLERLSTEEGKAHA
eukprot:m.23064 g.23064  ORF g.23064 m.23064 type:complete len:104 (+) comp8417_c0_seq2:1252-1563(+)